MLEKVKRINEEKNYAPTHYGQKQAGQPYGNNQSAYRGPRKAFRNDNFRYADDDMPIAAAARLGRDYDRQSWNRMRSASKYTQQNRRGLYDDDEIDLDDYDEQSRGSYRLENDVYS